jgi:hypothetical protein
MNTNNILIIGNGPCVLDAKRGQDIDKFDGYVLRFNNYKLEDYKDYLGSRVNIWGLGIVDPSPMLYAYAYDYILFYQSSWDGGYAIDKKKEALPNAKIIPISMSEINSCKKAMGMESKANPTTGLIVIWYYLNIDKKNISLHGFDYCDRGTEYYKNDTEIHDMRAVNSCHDMKAEKNYIQNLIKNDIIKIL